MTVRCILILADNLQKLPMHASLANGVVTSTTAGVAEYRATPSDAASFRAHIGGVRCLLILLPLLVAACGATEVALPYAPVTANVVRDNRPVVAVGSVDDERKEPDLRWIGTIRGGYGNPLKTIRTSEAVGAEVRKAFEQALAARGLLAPVGSQRYSLDVRILDFDANQYVRREANVRFALSLRNTSGRPVYSDQVHVNKVSGGIMALDTGIFADPQDLRALTITAMNQAIDEALDKPDFRAALSAYRPGV